MRVSLLKMHVTNPAWQKEISTNVQRSPLIVGNDNFLDLIVPTYNEREHDG